MNPAELRIDPARLARRLEALAPPTRGINK